MSIARIPAPPADISGGRLLATRELTASATYSTSSATFADVDATNAVISFNAPASGSVLVTLAGVADYSGTAGYEWSLRVGSSDVETTTMGAVAYARPTATWIITGLNPGTTYTYKWGFRRFTSGTHNIYTGGGGGTAGNMTMVVYDASTDTSPAYGGNSWETAVASLVSGLVHRWKFEETSGTTVADSVGSLPLTLSGTYTRNVTDTPPGLGVATRFAATGKALGSGLGSVPVTSAARTILAVLRTTGHLTAQSVPFSYGVSGARTVFGVMLNSGGTTADDGGFNGASAFLTPGSGVADANWHLIGTSYATQMLSSRTDGRDFSLHDSSAENTTASGNFTVAQFVDGTNQFLGDIADLLVWNRKLAPYELDRLYAGMRGAA